MNALPFRGLHYDLARGNYDSIPSLRRLIQFMSECKLNQLVLYMEDLWRYSKHPILSNSHAYQPEEIGELARYALQYGVDVIPSLTTFGHSFHILEKPEYSHLAFCKGADFDVNNEKVYELFGDLFDEVLPHFESPYVFLNGDEVNLSRLNEAAKEQAQRGGLGVLLGQGMARLAQMVLDRGKRPVIWHDMLLHHPKALEYLPRQTIIAYWYYDYQDDYPALEWFCKQGFDVIAAPSVLPQNKFPDYARAIPNIENLSRAAARISECAVSTPDAPSCLGTLLTLWEDVPWQHSALGIYAVGRWACDAGEPRARVLAEFARDVFGAPQPNLGASWLGASRDYNGLTLQQAAGIGGIQTRESLQTFLRAAEYSHPTRNADIHARMADAARLIAGFQIESTPPAPPLDFLSIQFLGADEEGCRIVRTSTPWNHELLILTNGGLAVAVLPQFGATMIEWILLGKKPLSFLNSHYAQWAQSEHLGIGDIGLHSPWATDGLTGWRECIFYNARLNPSSLWGREFEIEVLHQSPEKITIECRGENEVAIVTRTISLTRNANKIAIETIATNKRGAARLGIQPNVPHAFGSTPAALLELIEWSESEKRCRPLIAHDGTKLFKPLGEHLRIQSPSTGQYLQLHFQREEVGQILADCAPHSFTLEPFSAMRHCERGQSVRLKLEYDLGIAANNQAA